MAPIILRAITAKLWTKLPILEKQNGESSDLNCRNVLIDPKSIQDPKMISIADEIIKIGKKKKKELFMTPSDPTSKIVFWVALPHFSTDFIKKRCQNVQELLNLAFRVPPLYK